MSNQVYYGIFDALVLILGCLLLYRILHYLVKLKIGKAVVNILLAILFIITIVLGVNYTYNYNNNKVFSLYDAVPEVNSFSDLKEGVKTVYKNAILKEYTGYKIVMTISAVILIIIFLSFVIRDNKKHRTVIDRELVVKQNETAASKERKPLRKHKTKAYSRDVPDNVRKVKTNNSGEGLRAFTRASNYDGEDDTEGSSGDEKNISRRVNLIRVMNEALDEHDTGQFEIMVKNGANLDQQDEEGRSCLHFLCREAGLIGGEHFFMIKLLVENGADINIQDNNGNTPLHYIDHTRGVMPDIIKYLKEQGADLNIRNDEGMTPAENAHNIGNRELRDLFISD